MSNRARRFHAPMIVYFDAIRRAGSVREAARRLNVASSAVNRQLLKLEEELGTPLFDRLPGGLKLTHAGATFARHAIEVLQDAERVRSELEAMQGLRSGHVEIAAVEALTRLRRVADYRASVGHVNPMGDLLLIAVPLAMLLVTAFIALSLGNGWLSQRAGRRAFYSQR